MPLLQGRVLATHVAGGCAVRSRRATWTPSFGIEGCEGRGMLSRPDRILHWEVLETHLDEACFSRTQWERRLSSADYSLDEVARGDEQRLRAHLKALVAGGRRVRDRLLLPLLDGDDEERLQVAGFVLLADGEGQDPECILSVLREGADVQRTSMQRALELSGRKDLAALLYRELVEGAVSSRARLLEVLAFRQLSVGPRLGDFLRSEDLEVRIAALRAACRQPMMEEEVACLRKALGAPGPGEREAALGLGLRRGLRAAWLACPTLARQDDASGQLARLALALGGEVQDVERLVRLLEVPALRRHTLWALGFSGHVAAAEACLACAREPALAAVAAEAFCAITGLALEGAFRQAREPEESRSSAPVSRSPSVEGCCWT